MSIKFLTFGLGFQLLNLWVSRLSVRHTVLFSKEDLTRPQQIIKTPIASLGQEKLSKGPRVSFSHRENQRLTQKLCSKYRPESRFSLSAQERLQSQKICPIFEFGLNQTYVFVHILKPGFFLICFLLFIPITQWFSIRGNNDSKWLGVVGQTVLLACRG